MSDQQDTEVPDKEKVTISPEDCNAALDFWKHFGIPVTKELQEAMDAFAKDVTFQNQQRVKLEVCKAISITEHDAFKDDMFSKIREECEGVTFEMQFDKDFEAEVTVPVKE